MQPFQQRVVDEKAELDDRIESLLDFINTETYDNLPDDEKVRLMDQASVMQQYSVILEERIEAFK